MKTALCSIIALLSVYVWFAEAKADMDTFFTRYSVKFFPHRSNNNGCKDHADELRSSYQEAAKLIDAAVDAIATVKQNPRPKLLKLKDRWNWDRKAQTMLSMFGVRISSKGGPEPNSLKDFQYIERIFREMKYGMDNDETNGFRLPALYCNTDGWKFLENDADDPFYPGKKLSDKKDAFGDELFPEGAWYFNFNYIMPKGATSTNHGMCKPRVFAETYPPASIITWCNFGFATLGLSLASQGIKRDDYLDVPVRNSMSLTWVHELAHFYGSFNTRDTLPDQPAVTWKGKELLEKDGTKTKTYGVPLVLNLAKNQPHEAARTADAYAWFAVAMYLSDWNWSQGFAESYSLI